MNETRNISDTERKDRGKSDEILFGILMWTRWVLIVVAVLIVPTALRVPFFPLSIGGDQNDPGSDARVYFGVVFDEELTQAATFVEASTLMIIVLFGVYTMTQILGILRNVRSGNSFARDNGVRLRKVGFAGAAVQLLIYGIWILASIAEAFTDISIEGISMVITPIPWIGILITFSLATIFREGADLQEEQELTV